MNTSSNDNHSQIRFLNKINSRSTIVSLEVTDHDNVTRIIPAGRVKNAIKFERGPTNRTAEIEIKTLCLGELSAKVMRLTVVY